MKDFDSVVENFLKSNPRYPKLSRPAQKRVSQKIRKLIREGYEPTQAEAIAFSMERNPCGRRKKNPVEDKDLPQVIVALLHLDQKPLAWASHPDHIISVLVDEKLYDLKRFEVTDKGKKFLQMLRSVDVI